MEVAIALVTGVDRLTQVSVAGRGSLDSKARTDQASLCRQKARVRMS